MALAIRGIGSRGYASTSPMGVTPLWWIDFAKLNALFAAMSAKHVSTIAGYPHGTFENLAAVRMLYLRSLSKTPTEACEILCPPLY